MVCDDDAVGLKVCDVVAMGVAAEDGLAQQRDVAAGLALKVAADGPVVIGDEHVSGLALGAVDGLLQRAVEGRRRQRCDGIGSGFDGGEDHKGRV